MATLPDAEALCAQLAAQLLERCGGEQACEVRRQLALGRGLELGQHVGRAAAGEEARDDLRRHVEADARQLLRCHGRGDRLAVHQNAVTIENKDGTPDSGRRGRVKRSPR